MRKEADEINLEELIKRHAKTGKFLSKKKWGKSACMVAFFVTASLGTLAAVNMLATGTQTLTGLAVLAKPAASHTFSAWSALRASPDLTKIKLFFYTLWIIVVLVGTATIHETIMQNVNN